MLTLPNPDLKKKICIKFTILIFFFILKKNLGDHPKIFCTLNIVKLWQQT